MAPVLLVHLHIAKATLLQLACPGGGSNAIHRRRQHERALQELVAGCSAMSCPDSSDARGSSSRGCQEACELLLARIRSTLKEICASCRTASDFPLLAPQDPPTTCVS